MLTVMSYNVYVSLSILLGVAVGYTFFGQMLIEKRLKNTHLTMPCQHCVQSEGKYPLPVGLVAVLLLSYQQTGQV